MRRFVISFVVLVMLAGGALAQDHFTPVAPTGQPYGIIVNEAIVNGDAMQPGDEIGVFDGDECVGAGLIADPPAWPFPVTAWQGDAFQGLPGYTIGHAIDVMVFDMSTGEELVADVTWIVGNGTFGFGPFSQISLTAQGEPAGPHFESVPPTGQPYGIIVNEATIDGDPMDVDDEIGVFDADLCVGAGIVDGNWPFPVTAWQGDDFQGLPGFTIGHPIDIFMWDASAAAELTPEVTWIVGNGTFGFGPFAQVNLAFGEGPVVTTVAGNVYDIDSMDPIEGASVTMGDAPTVFTDVDGNYFIPEITPGDAVPVTVLAEGYLDYEDVVGLVEGENVDVNFPMEAVPVFPDIAVSDTEYDFGDVEVGTQADWAFTITNNGDADLEVTMGEEGDAAFTFDDFNGTIAPGGEETVTVFFEPAAVGDFATVLTITSNDPDTPEVVVNVTGAGFEEAGGPHFESVPPTGQPYGIIVNEALIDGNPMEIDDEIGVFDGDLCVGAGIIDGNWPFPVTAWQGDDFQGLPGFTIGHPIDIFMWDMSAEEELVPDVTWIVGNGTFGFGPFAQVNLNWGVAPAFPDIAVSDTEFDFGDVEVGTQADWTFTIANNGDADLEVAMGEEGDAAFTFDDFNGTIAPGGEETVTVYFEPAAVGDFATTLSITSNDPDTPEVIVNVTGTGFEVLFPDIDVSAADHDFGDVFVGETATWDLTISNVGEADLEIQFMQMLGDGFDFDEFTGTIPPGGEEVVTVTFAPQDIMPYEGTLIIASDDPDEPAVEVALMGNGIEEPGGPHFEAVNPTGIPYGLIITDALIDAEPVEIGDEIGVFDDDLCVGAGIIDGNWPFAMTAWQGDPAQGLPGYTIGHPMDWFMWDMSAEVEMTAEANYLVGNGTFGFGPFSQLELYGGEPPVFDPNIELSQYQYNFGDVEVGMDATWDLTISNLGEGDLDVMDTEIAGPGAEMFFSDGFTGIIPPGGEEVVTITFAPTAEGDFTADFAVHSNDPNTPEAMVNLSGAGFIPEPETHFQPVAPTGQPYGLIVMGAFIEEQDAAVGDEIGVFDGDLCVGLGIIDGNWPLAMTAWQGDDANGLPGYTIGNPMIFAMWDGEMEWTAEADYTVGNGTFGFGPFSQFTLYAPEIPVYEPVIEVSELAHDYGDVEVGMDATWDLTISNVGEGDLDVMDTEIAGPGAEMFFSDGFTGTIPPGGEEMVTITFAPTAEGEFVADFAIHSNDPAMPEVLVGLAGAGFFPEPETHFVSVDPTGLPYGVLFDDIQINFESVDLGDEVGIFDGDLCVGAGVVGEGQGWPFAVTAWQGDPAQGLPGYEIGNEMLFSVWDASAEMEYGGEPVYVVGNGTFGFGPFSQLTLYAPEAPVYEPVIAVSADFYDYGAVEVGMDAAWDLTISNVGEGDLDVMDTEIAGPGAEMFWSDGFSGIIPPGGEEVVTITFAPTAEGDFAADFAIHSNDPNNPEVLVGLVGNGFIPAPETHFQPVAPTGIPYGLIVMDAMIDMEPVEPGDEIGVFDGDLCVGLGLFEDPVEYPFAMSAWQGDEANGLPGYTIGNPMIFAMWDASAENEVSAVADYVVGNGTFGFGPFAQFTLMGGFVPNPQIEVSAREYDFGDVALGETSTWMLGITNVGNVDVDVAGVVSGDGFGGDFDGVLTPEEFVEFPITFNPMEAGPYTGTVEITSNDADEPLIVVNLSGNGFSEEHFVPVAPTGAPYAILVVEATIADESMEEGDEIGVFDGDLCVGAGIINGIWPFPVTTWRGDEAQGLPGFTIGNPISYNLWDASAEAELAGFALYQVGNGTFGFGPFSQVQLSDQQIGDPDITFSDDAIDFGSRLVGTGINWPFTIGNVGNLDLHIESVVVDGDGFGIPDIEGLVIAPGDEYDFLVNFTPDDAGEFAGTMVITSDDPDTPVFNVALTGFGLAPDIDVATEYDFGDVLVGNMMDWDLVISNVGDAPLHVGAITLEGDGFTKSALHDFSIPAGGTRAITITFMPEEMIEYNGTVTIESDDPLGDEGLVTVSLTGMGVAPEIDLSAMDYDFGGVPVMTTDMWDLEIFNIGTAPLTISTMLEGDGFTADALTDVMIDAGGSVMVPVTFAPMEIGMNYAGTLTVFSDDFDEPVLNVGLTGFGTGADLSLAEMMYDFGLLRVGTTADYDLVISNNGNTDLVFTAMLTGDGFVGMDLMDVTVLPGEDATMPITFAPDMVGDFTGQVAITSNDPFEPDATFDLMGSAAVPEMSVAPDVDFGEVPVGVASTFDLSIDNLGGWPLTISSATITAGDEFTIPEFADVVVDANGSATLTITFLPPTDGEFNGTLNILSDDPVNPEYDVLLTGIGAPPDIDVAADLDFGGVAVGSESTMDLTISNVGPAVLTVSSIGITGAQFSAPVVDEFTIDPFSEYLYPITFAPDQVGDFNGTVTIISDDPDERRVQVALTGQGLIPDIDVTPVNLAFGGLLVGTTDMLELTIMNDGEAPLHIQTTSIIGNGFTIPEYMDVMLAPGETNLLPVTFSPTQVGAYQGVLTITSNDPDEGAVQIPLTGAGLQQDIALNATEYDFGGIQTGTSATWDVVITNEGTWDLTVTSGMIVDGDAFSADALADVVIGAGDSYNWTVTFQPPESTTYTGSAIIESDDPDEPSLEVTFSGEGLSQGIELSATEHDFGTLLVNTSDTWELVISNPGGWPLNIESAVISDGGTWFSVPDFADVTVAGGGTAILPVTFMPDAVDAFAGTMTITSDDPDTPVVNVSLMGEGAEPDIALSDDILAFGGVNVGDTETMDLMIDNLGTWDLTIISAVVEGDGFDAPRFVDQTVEPGDFATLTISFSPEEATAYNGTVTILSDDPDQPSLEVILSGSGEAPDIAVDTNLLNYGDVNINVTSTLGVVVTNEGGATLTLTSATVGRYDDGFAVQPLGNTEIPAGESETIFVDFTPTEVAQYTGVLTIRSNDPDEAAVRVNLIGNGTYEFHFDPVTMTGLPYALIIEDAQLDFVTLSVGDEIGIFDGELCVGAALVDGNWPLAATAWMGDPLNGLEGATNGNAISYMIYSTPDDATFDTYARYRVGNGTFGRGVFSIVSIFGRTLEHFDAVQHTDVMNTLTVDAATIQETDLVGGDEIGVFDGDLCVGAAVVPEAGPAGMEIYVFGESGILPGFVDGNEASFTFWATLPGDEGRSEYAAMATDHEDGVFFGSDYNVTLDAILVQNLDIALPSHYFSLISTNLVPVDLDAAAVFDAAQVPGIAIVVDDHGGMYLPNPLFTLNTIGNIDVTEGYRVLNNGDADVLTISGQPMDPATLYTVNPFAWNNVGYPFDYDLPINIALQDVADQIDIVRTDDARMWIPRYNLNIIGDMTPGEGYQLKLLNAIEDPVTFQFNSNVLMSVGTSEVTELPVAEGAPTPTGLSHIILTQLSDDLMAEQPATIEIYDGTLLVGKSVVAEDLEVTPVVAWGGSPDYNIDGYTSGDEIKYVVRNSAGEKIPVVMDNDAEMIFAENGYTNLALTSAPMPTEFVVDQAYPNPFNPVATVPFAIPQAGEVTFTVFNVIGQQVQSFSGVFEAGQHKFLFDANRSNIDLVSGVYFMQVTFNGQVEMQKLLLLK